jgi:aspartate/tyrosine/aromatic aminotransferase
VAHTPGGTGALTVAARLLWTTYPDATVWISDPTWPNHRGIFADSGLAVATYPYYDAAYATVRFDEMVAALSQVGPHDAVVLHGCCHNPTGQDLTAAQWSELGALIAERQALAIVDTAYVGLGDGVEADVAGLHVMLESGADVAASVSFSKNLGLYGERAGALVIAGHTHDQAEQVQSKVKACVRTIYSNPPITGGAIVASVLATPELREIWLLELATVRDRINSLRAGLAAEVAARGIDRCRGTATGKGMFGLSGLTKDEVLRLRAEAGIYLVDNGRMNIAALTTATIPVFVDALEKLG